MKDRIIALRKALNLNQAEFAQRLGMKGTALSMVEVGKNGLTGKNIKLICMVFNVNEKWLRTGRGEMFNPDSPYPYEKEFFEIYRGLLPETRRALLEFARRLLETQERLMKKE
jgi:transcriptional regulator with XRE-family HTH domain